MKKLMMVGITMAIVMMSALLSSAEDRPSPQVIRAAQQGIALFLNSPKKTGLDKIGFSTEQDIQEAALGGAFRVFTVSPEKLLKVQPVNDFQSLSAPLNQWQFIITNKHDPKALLTVELVNGVWTPVSVGSAGLAQELSSVTKSWPASEGYTYRLIRIYQARSEFVELSLRDKLIGIIPLTSLNAATGDKSEKFNPLDLRDPGEIITNLRPVVKDNIGVQK